MHSNDEQFLKGYKIVLNDRNLNSNSKMAFFLFCDRQKLSELNKWLINGIAYQYYSLDSLMRMLGISKSSAVRALDALYSRNLIKLDKHTNEPSRIFAIVPSGHYCKIPKRLLLNEGLSNSAKLLYASMLDQSCFGELELNAKKYRNILGIGEIAFKAALDELLAEGLIALEEHKGKNYTFSICEYEDEAAACLENENEALPQKYGRPQAEPEITEVDTRSDQGKNNSTYFSTETAVMQQEFIVSINKAKEQGLSGDLLTRAEDAALYSSNPAHYDAYEVKRGRSTRLLMLNCYTAFIKPLLDESSRSNCILLLKAGGVSINNLLEGFPAAPSDTFMILKSAGWDLCRVKDCCKYTDSQQDVNNFPAYVLSLLNNGWSADSAPAKLDDKAKKLRHKPNFTQRDNDFTSLLDLDHAFQMMKLYEEEFKEALQAEKDAKPEELEEKAKALEKAGENLKKSQLNYNNRQKEYEKSKPKNI
jgi:hypothetical protein